MAKVILKNVRLAFCNVWEKVAGMEDGSTLKYRCKVLVPKSDSAQVDAVRAAIQAASKAGAEKHGKAWASKDNFNPLQDGDDKEWEGFSGNWHISASTTKNIHIVDRKRERITDEGEIYSGVYVNIVLDFYPYKTPKGLKGVSCDLGNIQKVQDGERWDGGSVGNVNEEFEELSSDDIDDNPF